MQPDVPLVPLPPLQPTAGGILRRLAFEIAFVALIFLVGALAGCSAASPERAFYDAIAPEYSAYVEADPALDEEDKAIRRDTLFVWDRASSPTASAERTR